MSLPPNLFATAFRQQRLGLMFTAIMAILVYLATLAMAMQGVLSGSTARWGQDLQGRITVELPAPADETAAVSPAQMRALTAALRAMPEVTAVTPLDADATAHLLQPWFHDPAVLASLPLPTLIDVQLDDGATMDPDVLQKKLSGIVSGAQVDAHADWLGKLIDMIRGLSLLAWLMISLTGVTLIIAISLICRAAMAVQHETLELLHLMGAEERDIVRQFLLHTGRLSWPAAVAGFGLAVITVGAMALVLRHVANMAVTASDGMEFSWIKLGLCMMLVPLAAVGGAMATARLSVQGLLRRLP